MIILIIYILLSVVMLVLYLYTLHEKQILKQWNGKSTFWFAFFYVSRSMVFLIIWPVLFAVYLNDKIGPKYRTWKYSRRLYLSRCNGVGIIECKACGYQERIICSIHHLRGDFYKLGYQCQKCGKHYAILNPYKHKKLIRCYCGGKLSRYNPVFCGECCSKIVTYHLKYLTLSSPEK